MTKENKMAFNKKYWNYTIYSKGWTVWAYTNTDETVAEMQKENYFQEMYAMLKTGDAIYLVGSDTVKQMYFVLENGNVKLQEFGK